MSTLRRTSRIRSIPNAVHWSWWWWLVVSAVLVVVVSGSSSSSSSGEGGAASTTSNSLPRSTSSSSIPRSHNHRRRSLFSDSNNNIPWNPSPCIDAAGFLVGLYKRAPGEWEKEVRFRTLSLKQPCQIRQVPGDGNCLFHSISLCLFQAINGTHWDITSSSSNNNDNNQNLEDLYRHSQQLRAAAVECLRSAPNRRLFLQGRESLRASELVQAAAQQYGLSASEYCHAMQQEAVWGGGPEIVALSNVLKRPIHVYELATSTSIPTSTTSSYDNEEEEEDRRNSNKHINNGPPQFVLRRMACFGSPRFDRNAALHILSADSRFPDIQPGNQLAAGNHFLAVFPVEESSVSLKKNTKPPQPWQHVLHDRRRVRGGFATAKQQQDNYHANDALDEEDSSKDQQQQQEQQRSKRDKWVRWWRDILDRVLLSDEDDDDHR